MTENDEQPRALSDPGPETNLVPVVVATDDDSDGRIGVVPFDQVGIVGRMRGWLLIRDLRDRSVVLSAQDGRFAAWRRRRTSTPTASEVAAQRAILDRIAPNATYAPSNAPQKRR